MERVGDQTNLTQHFSLNLKKPKPTETERKWIVNQIPDEVLDRDVTWVTQAYLMAEPEREIRVRKADEDFTFCVKTGSGKVREEHTTEITEEQARPMFEAALGVVDKSRREIPHGDHTIELDVYSNDLRGLAVAEIEDPPEDLEVPNWFGREVTEDPRFKNKNLATNNGTWPCL